MNSRTATYLRLQLKRAAKLMPQVLAVALLLGLAAALVGLMLSRRSGEDGAKQKLEIGVVGKTDDATLSAGLFALEHVDSSRFSIKLREMEEQAARDALNDGRIAAYIVIPEHFVEGMISGDHHPITYVTTQTSGFGTIAAEEIASAISRLLLETENAVYGAQAFAADYIPRLDPYDAGNALVQRYTWAVLNRDTLFEVETVGAADSLSLEGYYLCGIAVALLLLWGIGCSPLFSRRSRELCGVLNANGLGPMAQVLSEFAALCALLLLGMLCVGLLAGGVLPQLDIRVPELRVGGQTSFLLRLVPVGLMLAAQTFLLFEWVPDAVGGSLLQFLAGIVQGYLAGCFYPASFQPEGMRSLGAVLPAGVAMACLKDGLLTGGALWALSAALGYTLLFLLLAALTRRQRLCV